MNDILKDRLFRIAGIVAMGGAIVLMFQFARKFYFWLYHSFGLKHLYTFKPTEWLIAQLQKVLPFNLYSPALMLKAFTSVFHVLLIFGIVHLWFLDRRVTRMAIIMVGVWLGACFGISILGKLLHDGDLTFMAHTMSDYMLQPLGLAIVVPSLMLYRKQLPALAPVDDARPKQQRPPLAENEVEVTD